MEMVIMVISGISLVIFLAASVMAIAKIISAK